MTIAKAIAGGVGAAIGALLLVVTGNETLADVTTAEWLVVAGSILGNFGLVWVVPNKAKPSYIATRISGGE
jgi:hypothetical protein